MSYFGIEISYSQNKEDLFILELFKGIARALFYVELGAGDGVHFSNCKLLRENGWDGISYDADNKGNHEVIKSFITRENIVGLMPIRHIDFLSIDLDGNDFWVLKKLFENSIYPDVICCEVNSQLPNDKPLVINYEATRSWNGSYSYGMNYKAAIALLEKYGYSVIKNFNNTNLLASRTIIKDSDCGTTWSHPEIMPEGSTFLTPTI